jgi:pimeloyl-ACP methyl ester carboxylesterase
MKLVTLITWHQAKKNQYPLNAFINAYQHLLNRRGQSLDYLKLIQAPTYIIGGDRDQFFAKSCYEQTAQAIPNAQLYLFHGGHMVPVEKLNAVIEKLKEILG